MSEDLTRQFENLLRKIQLLERVEESQWNWRPKRVALAQRLTPIVMVAGILIYILLQENLTRTTFIITALAVGVCICVLLWQSSIKRDLIRTATYNDRDQLELFRLGLQLARSCGYEVILSDDPDSARLKTSLRIEGVERPFMQIYMGIWRPYDSSDGSDVESQLGVRVNFERETLQVLERRSP